MIRKGKLLMAIYAKIRANGEYHSQNFAYAVYGLQYLNYAKLISARWSQLLSREDEFDFRKYR